MITSLIIQSNSQLNNVPAENSVSTTIILVTTISGLPSPDYNIINRIPFGSYAQVTEVHDPQNNTQPRTTGAIALHATGNQQVSYYFMILFIRRHIHSDTWTKQPMVADVIASVEARSLI